MSNMSTMPKIAIIGAGMGGSLVALYLARLGYQVEVYERRQDMRKEPVARGKSINMTLAQRGLDALAGVGLLDAVMDNTIPLRGRMIHGLDGSRTFQPYGKNDHEAIHSIKRSTLNTTLMDASQPFPNVKMFFNKRCLRVDTENSTLHFKDEETGELESVKADFIIGADGAFSTVRQQMHRGVRANYKQDFLDWGYKELNIPQAADGSHLMESDALHIWPRGDHMLLAMPNPDGSFTCTCILPFEGDRSFASLRTSEDVFSLFKEWFSDAIPLMPTLSEDFFNNSTVEMITTHTQPWYFKDRVVLIGDACHAVVPFYGQGMNAAFEDCAVLSECLTRSNGNLEETFAEYQNLRKRNTDVLAELSKQNFVELRKKVKSPFFVARKKVDVALNRILPEVWIPLYTMVSHTSMPYADAVERFRKQNRIARLLGIDVVLLVVATGLAAWGLARNFRNKAKRKPLIRLALRPPFSPTVTSAETPE